jgi:outer membrane biosynthesis protein TonB/cob(I)alamin adenosyltransferase
VNTSILAQELAPIEAQIELYRKKQEALEGDLRIVEEELDKLSSDRQRFEALRNVCDALDKLGELNAIDLFWEGLPEMKDIAAHVENVRTRVTRFETEISGILEKQKSLQDQINKCLNELGFLYEEVRDAYEREERRKEEFIIEREISPVPYRKMVMPWTKEAESERYFRRAILLALLIAFVFGSVIPLINVPIPDRSQTVVEIPERLAKLVRKEKPKPPPPPEPQKEEEKEKPEEQKEEPKKEEKPKEEIPKKEQVKVAANEAETSAARKKAESVGVLKFKDAFADLMTETPKIGTEANLTDNVRIKGQATAQRSLVAMQATGGSSGGIGGAGVSRNVGNSSVNRLGKGSGNGTAFTRVESSIGGLEEAARPTSDGLPPGRTDEEIQIVFDRYKAALYRIYNKELRKNPTLRGKILMRITIEPDGSVSLCEVESTDLASPELVKKIVARVKRFNFGPKEDVQKMTILYPIDFLPAG